MVQTNIMGESDYARIGQFSKKPNRTLMMKKYFLMSLLFFTIAMSARAGGLPRPGDVAPDFTLQTLAGGPFTLSESLKRGHVMLIFYETQCVYCYSHINDFKALHQKYNGRGLSMLAVNYIGESHSTVREYARDNELNYGIALDYLNAIDVAEAYKVVGSPTIVLIAPDGKIASYGYTLPDVAKWVK